MTRTVDAHARLYKYHDQWRPFRLISTRHSIQTCMGCGERCEEIFECTVQVDGMSGTVSGVLLCRTCILTYREGKR